VVWGVGRTTKLVPAFDMIYMCEKLNMQPSESDCMPERALVATELARLFGVLGHRHRIQILEELRLGERDVNTLKDLLQISSSRVSQHLAQLRSHHLVVERRQGRHHFYSLTQPGLADWITDGLKFLERDAQMAAELRTQLRTVRDLWTSEPEEGDVPG